MAGLIGGSGSTGSSLLRQILNRHSHVFCGPETSLFCKSELYNNWSEHKKAIQKKGWGGLRSKSWHIFRGFELTKEEFNVTEDLLTRMIDQSETFKSFIEKYFEHCTESSEDIWLEKTPGNAYGFRQFLNLFPKGKVIHIYRNPYDTIASLVSRGFSHYQATCIYLLNTTFALSSKNSSSYTQLSYERLVNNPKQEVTALCSHLEIAYEEEMLMPTDKTFSDDPTQIKGWTYDETAPIAKGSIGKFSTLSKKDQEIIIYACKSIHVAPNTFKKENLSHINIHSLSKELDYDFVELRTPSYYSVLKNQKNKDLWLRTKKNAYYNFFNYPIVLNII